MFVLRIEHAVFDYERWKRAFDRDPADRRGAGVRRYRVFRASDDPLCVVVDLEFDTRTDAQLFLSMLETIWRGPGKTLVQNPRARIAECVDSKTY